MSLIKRLTLEIDLKFNKVSFLTTVFPMNESYICDFFDSLINQTYKNFDIVVINDGFEKFDRIKNEYHHSNIWVCNLDQAFLNNFINVGINPVDG